jgi:hypothetical protein
MQLVEKNVNQYIMNLNEEKYENLHWISDDEGNEYLKSKSHKKTNK